MEKWAFSNGISSEFILGSGPMYVVFDLGCVVQQSVSPSPINHALYSIK